MHLFYTPDIEGDIYTLNADESRHCVRVLRLGAGEAVSLVDGKGTWYEGVIERAEVRGCEIRITDRRELYGRRNFHLHLVVAPTKNIDRIEWMLEKCTEMGIDEITLLHAAHSERKVVKEERLEKVIVAAMKQSLKASGSWLLLAGSPINLSPTVMKGIKNAWMKCIGRGKMWLY